MLNNNFAESHMRIPFLNFEAFHSPIREEMVEAFKKVYDSNWLILGNNLDQFERSYAKFNETRYAVGVSNGLDAIFLALKSLDIGPGDEVIVPSNTFIATALAVSYAGAKPVFVEPDLRTYNIDPLDLESAITPETKAVIPVHLYGQACNMELINEIALHYGIYVIEDNAQAHGAAFKSKPTGSWGEINATSFYPGKNLGALGDAGAVTTNNRILADRVRTLRSYGSRKKYIHEKLGYNKRMDEIQAALLNVKLRYLKTWTQQRQKIANWYIELLTGVGDLILPFVQPDATHVYHLFVIRTKHRDKLHEYLQKKGIGTLIHYPVPPHLQKAYKYLNIKQGQFPVAEQLSKEVLSLPVWPGMNENMVEQVSSEIKKAFNQWVSQKQKSFTA